MRSYWFWISYFAITTLIAGHVTVRDTKPQAENQTNVVLLLADDLGWGDLSCKGGAVPTPHIDRLFSQGVELRTFLVMPVCSPTRAGLLTGRHPVRVGIAPATVNADVGVHMGGEETTLGEAFKAAGYTTALIGKWHLGYKPSPNQQGFDLFYGLFGAACDYHDRTRQRDGTVDWFRNGERLVEKGYTTDLIRDRAVRFVRENRDHPFFLYVPFTAVHNPVQATQHYIDRVPEAIQDPKARTRAGMVIALDDAVGAIVRALDDGGLAERTIVVFASDNGPTPDGSAKPFRGRKHTVYDGGVRSPTVIRWSGRLEAGRYTDALLGVEDLYPTLLKLTGVPIPQGLPLDGRDFSACLTNNAPSPRQDYCWIWRNCDAIRTARYRLIRYWDQRELYDLQKDPSETTNLVKQLPELARTLETRLDEWEASIPSYPSHVPIKAARSAVAAPAGEVLEVRVSRRRGPQSEELAIMLGSERILVKPGDRLEFDMLVAEGSTTEGFRVDIARPRRNNSGFARTKAVDQFGNLLATSASLRHLQGRWVRRVVGLANSGPGPTAGLWLNFGGKEKGDYLVYVDNVIFQRADGTIVELYRGGKPRQEPPAVAAGYSNISVKAVPVGRAQGRVSP
ncbi:MAG: sulfatase-like hydrolase/transferase [Acidobacteriota bacterium]